MPNYKVVDADQLDADLTAVADAIREKTGKEDKLTLEQMVEEIGSIEAGEEIFYVPLTGTQYTKHIKYITNGKAARHAATDYIYAGATELVSYETDLAGNGYAFATGSFEKCSKLENVILSRINSMVTPLDTFSRCNVLKTIQLGSIGFPVTALSDRRMMRNCSAAVELTIYVNATTLAEVPTTITGSAPWGNANATIIYRNSTTGEVITE